MKKIFLTILLFGVYFLHFKVNSLRCWKCNKQICDEIWEDDCDLDSCVTAKGFNITTGEEIQTKTCKSKEDIVEFCSTVKGSCVSCSEDLCNEGGTKCDFSATSIIASETVCFDKSYRCFSARDLNDDTNIIRGCVDKDKVSALCKNYTENGFSCSTCEGNFCNTDRIGRYIDDEQRCFFCKDDCLDMDMNKMCHGSIANFSCLSVYNIKPHGYRKKDCIRKDEIQATCDEYRKNGANCSTCDTRYCNTDQKYPIKCYANTFGSDAKVEYDCDGYDDFKCFTKTTKWSEGVEYGCMYVRDTRDYVCSNNTNEGIMCLTCNTNLCNGPTKLCYQCDNMTDCNDPKILPCAYSTVSTEANFSCFAAKGIENGQHQKVKGCILKDKIKAEEEKYKRKNFEFRVCDDGVACNHDRSTNEIKQCYFIESFLETNDTEDRRYMILRAKKCPTHTDFGCITTRRMKDGKMEIFKGCVVQDVPASQCQEYERNGYSCETCKESLCNKNSVKKCYQCKYNDCKEQRETTCPDEYDEEYACVSKIGASGSYHEKECTRPYKDDCEDNVSPKEKPLVCDVCFTELCNSPGLQCYICEEFVLGRYCKASNNTCFDKNYKCLMAEGKNEEGEIDKIKGCVHKDKTVSQCEEYKKKGYSCSVCDKDLCNKNRTRPVIKCFVCDSTHHGESCEVPKEETCPEYDDFSCLSIQYYSMYLSKLVQEKKCFPTYAVEQECKGSGYAKNFRCEACQTDLCNKDNSKKSELLRRSKGYRYSFQLSALMSAIIVQVLHVFL